MRPAVGLIVAVQVCAWLVVDKLASSAPCVVATTSILTTSRSP